MATAPAGQTRHLDIDGVQLELSEQGRGAPLLFLHAGYPCGRLPPDDKVLRRLAKSFRVIAPTHPGFGRENAPDWMTTADDLAYFYLDVLAALDLEDAVLAGASFGGWIAAEIAVKSTERLSRLVLANPVGIKVGGRETRDIVDLFSIFDKEIVALAYADPAAATPDKNSMSDEDFFTIARSREATARYGWSPYLHDPKLKGRLRRIGIPALVLTGAADRIVAPGYASAFADSIPGARLVTIEGAGHFPHREKPDAFADAVAAFAAGKAAELVP